MQFVLNNIPVRVESVAPDMTLLRYLRGQQNLTGTKEGCASGDCGACTVLIGSQGPTGWVYRAINSCICPLGSVDNQRVITVEGLSDQGQLHPVQQAMVDCHGSQCGFCTPGFVMSLAALHMNPDVAGSGSMEEQRHAVIDAISGNLCRCTGYRPIIDAGLLAFKKPAQPINIVQEWSADAPLAGNPVPGEADCFYAQPTDETGLQALLQQYPDARLIAGGTDLMLEVTQFYKTLPQLIDLNRVSGLQAVEIQRDGVQDNAEAYVEIGAAATYTRIERALSDISPDFVQFLGRLGSRQIRNRGTLGGNICNASPIADTPPFLLVLDAELLIGNAAGEYRREPISQFYRAYKHTTLVAGEYLAKIRIKREALDYPVKLYKISKRYEDDISAVMGAFLFDGQQQLRIAFGGMAAIPRRAHATEKFLHQTTWHRDGQVLPHILEQACDVLRNEFSPMSDVRASAEYRMAMACNLLKKACNEIMAQLNGQVVAEGVFDHA